MARKGNKGTGACLVSIKRARVFRCGAFVHRCTSAVCGGRHCFQDAVPSAVRHTRIVASMTSRTRWQTRCAATVAVWPLAIPLLSSPSFLQTWRRAPVPPCGTTRRRQPVTPTDATPATSTRGLRARADQPRHQPPRDGACRRGARSAGDDALCRQTARDSLQHPPKRAGRRGVAKKNKKKTHAPRPSPRRVTSRSGTRVAGVGTWPPRQRLAVRGAGPCATATCDPRR